MAWTHRTLIVPADQVELARSLCAALAGPAGEGMFNTPLSATGLFPATHYISTGLIENTFASILPLDVPETEDAPAQSIPGNPEAVIYYLPEDYEPKLTLDDVESLFNAIDVTEGDATGRMAFLGLSMCSDEG